LLVLIYSENPSGNSYGLGFPEELSSRPLQGLTSSHSNKILKRLIIEVRPINEVLQRQERTSFSCIQNERAFFFADPLHVPEAGSQQSILHRTFPHASIDVDRKYFDIVPSPVITTGS
jgi:hypothetical protein